MKSIRLAVIFDQPISVGGGYQQSLNSALIARALPSENIQVLFYTTLKENVTTLAAYGFNVAYIGQSLFGKIWSVIRCKIQNRFIFELFNLKNFPSPFEKVLLAHKIDLVYFLSPCSWAQHLEKLNYITTVWDISHLDTPEFPEVRWKHEFQLREKNLKSILPRATAILVDSEYGKQNLSCRYDIPLERIHASPFEPAVSTRNYSFTENQDEFDVPTFYGISVPYVYYPAQFWAHKNHVYLLDGLRALEDRYDVQVGAIFSGSDHGNRDYVEHYVAELGLKDRVRFAGFVSDDQLVQLYRQSLALVMPTYFGPTNLPPLEAFQLGVPVLYPDRYGLRDQVGDAALLMDLADPQSLALHLFNLISDPDLGIRLVASGYKRIKYLDSFDHVGLLYKIVSDFRRVRMCWR